MDFLIFIIFIAIFGFLGYWIGVCVEHDKHHPYCLCKDCKEEREFLEIVEKNQK